MADRGGFNRGFGRGKDGERGRGRGDDRGRGRGPRRRVQLAILVNRRCAQGCLGFSEKQLLEEVSLSWDSRCSSSPRRGPKKDEEEKWVPVTKLGRLVEQVRQLATCPGNLAAPADARSPSEQGKIKSLEQIYLHSLPVKEYQIVDAFLGAALKDEVMKASFPRFVHDIIDNTTHVVLHCIVHQGRS